MITILEGTDKAPLQKIGQYAGLCWNSPTDNPEKNIKRAKECITSGHGRVLEYANIEFIASEYSARCIRELYTHIGGGPTRLQESTRYVNCEQFDYYEPPLVLSNPDVECVYTNTMDAIKAGYAKLIELGMSKEDAANVLPLGMNSKVVMKCNLRMLENFMNMRLCSRAYKEIRTLANELRDNLKGISPEWEWICGALLVPKCEKFGYCTEAKCCGRKPKKSEVIV